MINKYDLNIFPIKRSQMFFICARGVATRERKKKQRGMKAVSTLKWIRGTER